MMKRKTLERLMRVLITAVGAGLGAGVAALLLPYARQHVPGLLPDSAALSYVIVCALFALLFFALSGVIVRRLMRLATSVERRWSSMPMRQIVFTSAGMLAGLIVAALLSQLVLSVGASLLTISFSALLYLMLGYIGMQVGGYRYHRGRQASRRPSRGDDAGSLLDGASLYLDEEAEDAPGVSCPPKILDTSVLIDGRVLDIAKAGFLEGELIVADFVLRELQHIADSADGLRRARGRRGLDVLRRLREALPNAVTMEEITDASAEEVDIRLLRLARERGGVIVTNDYNLNKVAAVTGIRALNLNDLANAVKPMLTAGEEMTAQIVREGKEPGQGVAYLEDGTMIVVENGRRRVGERAAMVVTTVLQTSAGRMIFARLKDAEEKAG